MNRRIDQLETQRSSDQLKRMGRLRVLLLLFSLPPWLASIGLAETGPADESRLLDWAGLRNPVLTYDDWSIKDFSVEYLDGVFYLFFSAFYEDRGQVRSHVVEVSTKDFKKYSDPILSTDGREDEWAGMCSPSLCKVGETYILTFNSWGDREGRHNQLFFMTSEDLVQWSHPRPLAANLTKGNRAIDPAVAYHNDRFYLMWKERQSPRIAVGESMDGDFQFIRHGYSRFRLRDGEQNRRYENYQFIKIDGRWRLLVTFKHDRHLPYLFDMRGDGSEQAHFLAWTNGRPMRPARESFNTLAQANASFVSDWRQLDGHFYLLYAGCTTESMDSPAGRGWNRLGLSRSRDLETWHPAGQFNSESAIE